MKIDDHPDSEDYRNRAERAEAECAELGVENERLRALVIEALTKQENDRTLWNEEWQVWASDVRAALKGRTDD